MIDKAVMHVLSDNVRGALLMAASMAAFAINDALIKLAMADLGLFQAVFLRGLFATTFIAIIAWRSGAIFVTVPKRDRRFIALRTLGELGATACFLTALFNMPIANATAILQVAPLAVTLAAALFMGETVGWRRYTAIAVGFVGVLIIVRPGTEGFNNYSLSALGAVGFLVLRDMITRRLSSDVPSVFVALTTSVSVTVMGAILAPVTGWHAVAPDGLLLLGAAAGFLIFGYLFSVMTMRVGEVGFVAPFRYSVLVFAILLGFFVFGDVPDAAMLTGSAVIVATGVYSFHRDRRRRALEGRSEQIPPVMRRGPL